MIHAFSSWSLDLCPPAALWTEVLVIIVFCICDSESEFQKICEFVRHSKSDSWQNSSLSLKKNLVKTEHFEAVSHFVISYLLTTERICVQQYKQ